MHSSEQEQPTRQGRLMADHEHITEYIPKIVVVEFNIILALLTQIFFLTEADNELSGAIAVTLLSGFSFLYILIIFFIIARDFRRKERFLRKHSKSEFLTNLLANGLTAVSGLMYLLGNHMSLIFQYYGEWYGCVESCMSLGINISSAFLITSILLFRLIPTFVNKAKVLSDHTMDKSENTKKSVEYKWSPWKTTAQSLGYLLELDAWFTTVSDLPLESESYCPEYIIDLAWAMFVIGMVVWGALLILILVPGVISFHQRKEKTSIQFFIVCLNVIVLWVVSGTFLLTDNIQPLGCSFGCHMEGLRNQTSLNFEGNRHQDHVINCHYDALHSTRLAILFLALVYYTSVSIALVIHSWRKYHVYKMQMNPARDKGENGIEILDVKSVESNNV